MASSVINTMQALTFYTASDETGRLGMSTLVQSQIKQLIFQTTSKKSTLSNQFIQKRDGLIFNVGQFPGNGTVEVKC